MSVFVMEFSIFRNISANNHNFLLAIFRYPTHFRNRKGWQMGLDVSGKYRYPVPDVDWLALSGEEVIEPALPIIDAHHHLWIENGVPYLGKALMDDLASGHCIGATVFVQAHYGYRTDGPTELAPVGETEKVRQIAQECAASGCSTRVADGIVAFADLMMGSEVERVIEAHSRAAGGALRGIRHSVSCDPNYPSGIVIRPAAEGLLCEPSYRQGLAALVRHNLSYDAMLYHRQIPELTELASAIPDLSIVLDHMGTMLGIPPYDRNERETFADWKRSMTELAQHDNVKVKIGGLGMIICGASWHERPAPPTSLELAEAWRPQIETCIELFGAGRCMFESNFPVDKAMYSYRTLWNTFKRLTVGASEAERTALFSGTAAQTYRIECPPTEKMLETSHV